MKLRYAWLALVLSVLVTTPALAGPADPLRAAWKKLATSIPAPAEWAGVWSELDSEYTCTPFALYDVSTELDTVCTGQQVTPPGTSSAPITIDCTGTADANSVHMTCSGSGEVVPGCSISLTMTIDATRTADTFYSVNRFSITYGGALCGSNPPECYEDHVHGTRISPEPSAYCATPTLPSTWGSVKSRYR